MIVEVSAPKTVKMGSIGGGGRYDDLTSTFGLKNMSGIGVSFGFERIYLVMEALNLFPKELLITTEVLFANFGSEAATIAYSCVSMLRKQNVSCELYPTEAKLKKQLGYADQKNIQKIDAQLKQLDEAAKKITQLNQSNSTTEAKLLELNRNLLLLEETVQAFDSYRKQNNELMQELQLQVSSINTANQ